MTVYAEGRCCCQTASLNPNCPVHGHASSNRVQRIADAIRPALNIYPDGVMRVSHGQEDIAETVVRLVLEADAIPNRVEGR